MGKRRGRSERRRKEGGKEGGRREGAPGVWWQWKVTRPPVTPATISLTLNCTSTKTVWCGLVWSGVVKCIVVWCGAVWCGVVW